MGQAGTKIVDLDVKELIADLNRAYADEWLAFYSYTYMSQVVSGRPASKQLSEKLKEIAAEELEHQEELAERITSLGGKPVADPMKLVEVSNAGYPTPPADETDLAAMVQTVLKAEAEAIRAYDALARKTYVKDMVTHQLIHHILEEEIQHEDDLERVSKL